MTILDVLECRDVPTGECPRDQRPPRRHARHRADRRLLHDDAARPARPRPRRGRLLALGRARRGVQGAVGRATRDDEHRRGRQRPRRRHRRRRPAQPHARGGDRRRGGGRQGGAVHQAARPHRRRRPSGSSISSSRPASSPATSRTSSTRRRRSRRWRRSRAGAIGDVLWVRSRETHPGPHSAWFWDADQAGGGCIVDLGCHCIEIIRSYVGKGNRPVEVMCWSDTLVHPIEAEDNAIALIRFESGAIGQFEVSWTFRGGMDLRDEVAGTEGTIWTNHFLRTGFEMFSSGAGRLRRREGRDGERLDLPGRRRGRRARLRRHVHRHVRRHRRGPRAGRDVLRRLRRQRRDGRLLPLGGEPAAGSRSSSTGAAARRRGSPGRRAPRTGST